MNRLQAFILVLSFSFCYSGSLLPKEAEEPSGPTSLDITYVDEENVKINEDFIEGIHIKTFFPHPEIFVTHVLDSGTLVWEGNPDERCTSCVIHARGGFASLLDMTIRTETSVGFRYFVKKGGSEWTPISEEDFDLKFDTMKQSYHKLSKPSPTQKQKKTLSKETSLRGSEMESGATSQENYADGTSESTDGSDGSSSLNTQADYVPKVLDISDIDRFATYSYTTTYNGITISTYRARDLIYFSKVMDKEEQIWEASEGEKCTLGEFYREEGYYTLFLVRYKRKKSYFFRYFVKGQTCWRSIDKTEFYQKLSFLNL